MPLTISYFHIHFRIHHQLSHWFWPRISSPTYLPNYICKKFHSTLGVFITSNRLILWNMRLLEAVLGFRACRWSSWKKSTNYLRRADFVRILVLTSWHHHFQTMITLLLIPRWGGWLHSYNGHKFCFPVSETTLEVTLIFVKFTVFGNLWAIFIVSYYSHDDVIMLLE